MSQSFRLLCVCLGVAILVALQAHGVIDTRHRLEHALQFPGVSYAEAATIDHDHEHDQTEPAHTEDASAFDVADRPGGDSPINHHHHGGGDVHVALATPAHQTEAVIMASARLGPASGLRPPGIRGDGPSHPPKQQRLIA